MDVLQSYGETKSLYRGDMRRGTKFGRKGGQKRSRVRRGGWNFIPKQGVSKKEVLRADDIVR